MVSVTSLSCDGAWDCCSISLKSESGRLMAVPINCRDISSLPGVVVIVISFFKIIFWTFLPSLDSGL